MAVPSFRGTCLDLGRCCIAEGPTCSPGLFVDTRLPLATSLCKQASRAQQLGLRDRVQRVIIVVTASSTVVDLNVAGEHKITTAVVAWWRKPVARALPAPLPLGFGLSVFTVRLCAAQHRGSCSTATPYVSAFPSSGRDHPPFSPVRHLIMTRRPHGCNRAASTADCRSVCYSSRFQAL